MFKDYYHSLKITYINDKKYAIKTLNNTVILRKEFEVMKFIECLNISPKVLEFGENQIIEEYLDGKNLHNINLDDALVFELANKLNKLHKIDLPENIKKIIKDDFVSNDKYQPLKLFEFIVTDISKYVNYNELKKLFAEYDKHLKSKDYKMGLIHGDLNPGNIISGKEGLFFVDWTDCRYDILSCDVSQLFYVFGFSEHQKNLFLQNYNSTCIDKTMLEMHYLFLLLFELSDNYKKTKTLKEDIIKKIDEVM